MASPNKTIMYEGVVDCALEGKGIYMEIFGLNRAHPNLTLGARLGILLMHLVQVHLGETIQLEDLGISAAHTPSS